MCTYPIIGTKDYSSGLGMRLLTIKSAVLIYVTANSMGSYISLTSVRNLAMTSCFLSFATSKGVLWLKKKELHLNKVSLMAVLWTQWCDGNTKWLFIYVCHMWQSRVCKNPVRYSGCITSCVLHMRSSTHITMCFDGRSALPWIFSVTNLHTLNFGVSRLND